MYPARYYRQRNEWSRLIGKLGKVLLLTQNRVTNNELEDFGFYNLALVEFKDKSRKLFICTDGVKDGDNVEVVFRKIYSSRDGGLINYGCKVKTLSIVD